MVPLTDRAVMAAAALPTVRGMRPAASIIAFGAFAGAGCGLLVWLGLATAVDPQWPTELAVSAAIVAVAFVVFGLVCSTYHLTHPRRAWRSLSRWRTSWLSREAVAVAATLLSAGGFVLVTAALGPPVLRTIAAIFLAISAFTTIGCTAMVYASLRPVAAWHGLWMPVEFILVGMSSGSLLLFALARVLDQSLPWLGGAALAAVAITWAAKEANWHRSARQSAPANVGAVTGLAGWGRVRPFESPHTGESFLTREMRHPSSPRRLARLRWLTRLLLFVLPALLMLSAQAADQPLAAGLAVTSAVGALACAAVGRWLFFAEATHTSALYYADVA